MRRIITFYLLGLAMIAGPTAKLTAGNVVYGKGAKLTKEKLAVPYFTYIENGSTADGNSKAPITGWDFILKADKLQMWDLQDTIVDAVLGGCVPDAIKSFRKLVFKTPVVDSVEILRKPHKVELWILTEYISIGTDSNFVRMPMGPLAAQTIADSLGCILPTTYIVDRIAEASQGHLEIFPFRPLGDRNCQPIVFQDSNNAINALYKERGYKFGDLISGLKKDVVLTYKIHTLSGYENRVAIYGWHVPDGSYIQPLYVKHVNYYVDYSHGIRLIYRKIKVDGKEYDAKEILESPQMYRLLSDEPMYIRRATYEGLPKWYPQKSIGF